MRNACLLRTEGTEFFLILLRSRMCINPSVRLFSYGTDVTDTDRFGVGCLMSLDLGVLFTSVSSQIRS